MIRTRAADGVGFFRKQEEGSVSDSAGEELCARAQTLAGPGSEMDLGEMDLE